MNYYTKILPWENSRRLRKLTEFRALVIEYFNNSRGDWMVNECTEQPPAEEARRRINRMMEQVHDIILHSGVNPLIRYTPPPAIGGYIQNIDLIQNIFNLHRFSVAPSNLLDFIDRAIGIYENNARQAFFRAINPFFYISLILEWIARLPFVFIGRVGFNRQKAEESLIGRIIKGSIYIIAALASLLTVLQLLDFLEPVKGLVKGIFN